MFKDIFLTLILFIIQSIFIFSMIYTTYYDIQFMGLFGLPIIFYLTDLILSFVVFKIIDKA